MGIWDKFINIYKLLHLTCFVARKLLFALVIRLNFFSTPTPSVFQHLSLLFLLPPATLCALIMGQNAWQVNKLTPRSGNSDSFQPGGLRLSCSCSPNWKHSPSLSISLSFCHFSGCKSCQPACSLNKYFISCPTGRMCAANVCVPTWLCKLQLFGVCEKANKLI